MRTATLALLLLAAAATPIAAQLPPPPPPPPPLDSAHVQTIDYLAGQTIPIQATPGYQVTIEFGGDERIENVALGDSNAWQVTANRRGDHLFVKPLQAGVLTNMTVVTDMRLYTFELAPLAGPVSQMAYAIRFRYPQETPATPSATPGASAARYRLSGDRDLRPAALWDDGVHTYLQWPAGAALPAVYALDADGHEALANGAMRDGTYVVDSIAPRLVFRRDKRTALADRRLSAKRR